MEKKEHVKRIVYRRRKEKVSKPRKTS